MMSRPYSSTIVAWFGTAATRLLAPLILGILLGRWAFTPAVHTVVHLADTSSGSSAWSQLAGGDPRIYDAGPPDVTPGKPSPVNAGSFRFEDARGAYERREFPTNEPFGGGVVTSSVIHEDASPSSSSHGAAHHDRHSGRRDKEGPAPALYVNVLFTKAGHFRSGDIHKCHQVNQVVAGRARVTMVLHEGAPRGGRGGVGFGSSRGAKLGGGGGGGVGARGRRGGAGKEVVTELRAGDQIVIPPHVPHLYEFVEDTLMTEAWVHGENRTQCPFHAWFYRPLRERIPEDTQRSVFTERAA